MAAPRVTATDTIHGCFQQQHVAAITSTPHKCCSIVLTSLRLDRYAMLATCTKTSVIADTLYIYIYKYTHTHTGDVPDVKDNKE